MYKLMLIPDNCSTESCKICNGRELEEYYVTQENNEFVWISYNKRGYQQVLKVCSQECLEYWKLCVC